MRRSREAGRARRFGPPHKNRRAEWRGRGIGILADAFVAREARKRDALQADRRRAGVDGAEIVAPAPGGELDGLFAAGRHGARIYVGEFSAAAWAPGAETYLRDCIELFEEYGWDWTYHAFRESRVWDVEMEGPHWHGMVPADDSPRKRALLDGLRR